MVLLIDHDAEFRAALAAHLLDDGYRVVEFSGPGQVSLPYLERLTVLILDYQMAGRKTLEFTDHFHASHPDVPIILTCTHWPVHLEAETATRPYVILRRKPIDYDELATLLPPAPQRV